MAWCLPALLACGPSLAQEDAGGAWAGASAGSPTFLGQSASLTLGGGPLVAPAYEGAKKFTVGAFPMVDLRLFNGWAFASGAEGLGVIVVKGPHLKVGLAATYGMGRTSSDSARLAGLKDLPAEPGLAGFIRYDLMPFSVGINVKNYFGPNPGTTVSFGGSYILPVNPRLNLAIGPQMTWGDSRYNQAHFGVTSAQAAAAAAEGNMLSPYKPGSGITNVGVSLSATYQVAPQWEWVTRVGLSELVDSTVTDSPLVERLFQPSAATGIAYRF